jgi:hypothetical protein
MNRKLLKENKNLSNLIGFEKEISEVMIEMKKMYGSMSLCKTSEDYGWYRYRLMQLFDKKIKEMKNE